MTVDQIGPIERGRRPGGSPARATTRCSRADPSQRLARLREVAPKAVRGRSKVSRLVGRIPGLLACGRVVPAGYPSRVTLAELNTVVYARDPWLPRIDIARAADRDPRLGPAIDGRIVAVVVAERAGGHGQRFHLRLTGPAGGS